MAKPLRVKMSVTGNDGKDRLYDAGIAWPGKEDGKVAFRLELFAHSLDGKYVVFHPKDEDDENPME